MEKALAWLKAKPWHWIVALLLGALVVYWIFFRGSGSSSQSNAATTESSNLAGYYALESASTLAGNQLADTQIQATAATNIAQIQATTATTEADDALQVSLASSGAQQQVLDTQSSDALKEFEDALSNNLSLAGINENWQGTLLTTGQTGLLTPTIAAGSVVTPNIAIAPATTTGGSNNATSSTVNTVVAAPTTIA